MADETADGGASRPSLHIGASGYSYADWKGRFYPERCSSTDMLGLYARRFGTVELNFTYYRPPEAKVLESMIARVRPVRSDFLFSIKAHRTLTHEIGPGWQDDARAFVEATQVLQQAGHLGAVLLQFPYSFHYSLANRRHLAALLEALSGLPCACEFRSREWLVQSVFDGLRERGTALVAVDEPPLPKLLPPLAVPTGPVAYVRFHGRNSANWWRGDNASRYDYLYSEDELTPWIERVRTLAQAARQVFVYFNNHWEAQAPQNAEMFRRLLVRTGGNDLAVEGDAGSAA